MIETFFSVLPILSLFVIGYVLKRIDFFSPHAVGEMKKLVSHLALPALLFQAFASIEVQFSYLTLVALVFISCAIMVSLGKLLAKPVGMTTPYFPLMMGGFEMGMLGYALYAGLYGQQHLGKMALVDLGQVLFVYFVLMVLLIREGGGISTPRALLKRFITSPAIIGIFLGLLVSALKPVVTPGAFLNSIGELIDMLARITVPLIALTIGFGTNFQKEGIVMSLKTILVRKAIALVIVLLLNTFIVDRLLGMDALYRYAMMVMFLLPTPYIIPLFMHQGDTENLNYVSNTLSLDTVISLFAIVAAAVLYT
jgi:hypothetical protein